MDHRNRILVVLIGALLACLPAAHAADGTRAPRSVLEGAKELEKRISYTETKIPLGELIQKVAADTGARLSAAPEVADEPVAVVVSDLPARELLVQLAELLDYRWRRRAGDAETRRRGDTETRRGTNDDRPPTRDAGRETRDALSSPTPNTQHPTPLLNAQHSTPAPPARYEIYQDLAARGREEELRRTARAEVEQRFMEEIRRCLEVAALPAEELRRLQEEGRQDRERRERLPAEQRLALEKDPAEQARSRRYAAAERLWSPVNRGLAVLLGRLTPGQWELLRREGRIQFSTDPQPGELRLPEEMARAFRAAMPATYPPGQDIRGNSPQAEALRKQEEREQAAWKSAAGYRAVFRLDTRAFEARGGLFLIGEATPFQSGPEGQSRGSWFGTLGGARLFLSASPETLPAGAAEADPARLAALAQDPVLGAVKRFEPKVRPRPKRFAPGSTRLRLRDLLPDLARAYGAQFIADAYWNAPPLTAAQLAAGETALGALLDRLAGNDYVWERQDGLVRIRGRDWFFDRPREIPLRLVRRWTEQIERHKALPFEEVVEMAAALSEPQLDNLPELGDELGLPGLSDVYFARHALRLYRSLSPAQRPIARGEKGLPVAQMTPAQRALFVAWLRDPSRHRDLPLGPGRVAAGAFAVSDRQLLRFTREEDGRPVTYLMPPDRPLPPGLNPSAERSPVTQVQFHFKSGTERSETWQVTVAPLR